MKRCLDGEVAVVTGGGRGIGRAIAIGLAAAGATVGIVARTKEQVEATKNIILRCGSKATALCCDVTNALDVKRVTETMEERFGPISLLVNNAGIAGPFGPVWTVDPEKWWATQMVHVFGAMLFMNAVLPRMIELRKGRVINVASMAGTRIVPCISGYAVAKATLIRLTGHVAAEGRTHGVAAFAIEPGTVITALAEETMASPDAMLWTPSFVEMLKNKKHSDPGDSSRSSTLCVALASGRYDILSGRLVSVDDDIDLLQQQVAVVT